MQFQGIDQNSVLVTSENNNTTYMNILLLLLLFDTIYGKYYSAY